MGRLAAIWTSGHSVLMAVAVGVLSVGSLSLRRDDAPDPILLRPDSRRCFLAVLDWKLDHSSSDSLPYSVSGPFEYRRQRRYASFTES